MEALTLLGTPTLTPTPTPTPEPVDGPAATPPLAWGKEIRKIHGNQEGQIFLDRIYWTAWKLSQEQGALFDANWLMACMAFETGRKFTANVRNPRSSATGLIQFMDETAKELGTTTTKLAAMKATDQINYVYKYFSRKIRERGPIRSLEDCYMAILWPAAVGKASEYPLFIKGTSSYAVNSGLDKNKDSKVTKAEAAFKVQEQLVAGMRDENFG